MVTERLGLNAMSVGLPCNGGTRTTGTPCHSELDTYGRHPLVCVHSRMTRRHNAVRNILAQSARSSAIQTFVEQRNSVEALLILYVVRCTQRTCNFLILIGVSVPLTLESSRLCPTNPWWISLLVLRRRGFLNMTYAAPLPECLISSFLACMRVVDPWAPVHE